MNVETNILQNSFFTVVITTYNREHIVINAINSLINQTFTNWNCVIVDDGSTDNTFSKLKSIIRKDKRFRYIYHSNRKQAISKSIGIINSFGEYVTFLDSDDYYLPNHLQSRYNILYNNNIDLLHGGVSIIGDKFVPNIYNLNERVSIFDCVIGGTFFVKNDLFKKIGLFDDIEYGDDTSFFKKALISKAIIGKTNIPTYVYNRLSEDSICNSISNEN